MSRPLLYGTWRHGNGIISNGTVRVLRQDFDTNPAEEYKEAMLDWICETLNKATEYSQQQPTKPTE